MEEQLLAPEGIRLEDWPTTPESVRLLVLALLEQLAILTERIRELEQ